MSLITLCNEVTEEELRNGGFSGTYSIEEYSGKPHFEACIDLGGFRKIDIKFNPEYEKKNPGKITEVVRDISRHEINHRGYKGFSGCPRTLDAHVEHIFEPIAEVLIPKGYTKTDIHYMANALEDTILHSDLNSEFRLQGITDFFQDVAECSGYSNFYEAHVKLNMFLFGNKSQKKQLARYFEHKSEVREVLENFLKRTGIKQMTHPILVYNRTGVRENEKGIVEKIEREDRTIQASDRKVIRDYLNDEKNWPEIARIYAEEFSKLMNPNYALPLLNHSGNGTKGRENEKTGAQIEQEGNEFDREMESESYRAKRIQKAYSENQGIPKWMDYFDLDLLYQSLAKKLTIKAESFTEQDKMPIYWYGKRPFDPDKDNLKHTTFGFDDKGNIELRKKRWHENIPISYKISPKGFPEVKFCLLDTSGSMSEPAKGSDVGKNSAIPWGDKSKYHFALLGWYGLLEYLRENHLLKQQSISLGNFSNEFYYANGLREAKKLALKPQFGGTEINIDKLRKILTGKENLVFTISDGEIGNWGEIKDDFIKLARNNHYFHLQTGGKNTTTEDLEKAGLSVEYVSGSEDLANKVIDITDKLYRR